MDIHDYLLDQAGVDWEKILSDWSFLIPASFTIWLVNRFGDLFIVPDDGSVHLLDTGRGVLERVADNQDDFCNRIDRAPTAENWLFISIVDELVRAGKTLAPGTVYSFKVPPILGGEYVPGNFDVVDIAVHYAILGQFHGRIKGLPEGARIGKVEIKDPE